MPPHPVDPPAGRPGRVPGALMERLLHALRRPRPRDTLPPAGSRSGHGSRSLEPYLEQARNSRPSPLD
jgi:hypothetical protein